MEMEREKQKNSKDIKKEKDFPSCEQINDNNRILIIFHCMSLLPLSCRRKRKKRKEALGKVKIKKLHKTSPSRFSLSLSLSPKT